MSNNVEDQIVSMKFDNKQFESGVATSIATTEKLKNSLSFPDAGKGLGEIDRAAKGFNLNPMAGAIDGVSKKWIALTTVAVTALSNITNKAVNAGLGLVKSFTFDPIKQGFQEYEKNLNSIQTIMANTQKPVGVVNKYLNQLNHYSDQTIYNFGTMADAIGKFTAAGVKVDVATSSIKGMANSAALGGADVNQLNTAMIQVSQALSAGTIKLQDWNSINTAGLGGTNMQNTFKATALTIKGTGDEMEAAIAKAGNFRESLTSGWLSADVFNKAMTVMAGKTNKAGKTVAFTVKQLQGMGYSDTAAKKLHTLSQAAIDSATKVKTASQLIDVVKESIGSGWSKIFQDVFGNFTEASKLWTGVSNTITGAVGRVFGAVDKMLVGWRDLGGFNDLWTTVGNVFKILGNLIHPVVALFQALLPSTGKAGTGLAKFTSFLADFTGMLVKLTSPMGNFNPKLSFMGELFSKVGSAVSAFVHALSPLVPILQKVGNSISGMFHQGMEIAGNLIDGWVSGLDPAALQQAAVDLANSWITWIKDALGIHSPAATMVPIGTAIIEGIAEGLKRAAQGLIAAMQQIFLGLGKAMKWAVQNISYDDVLNTINSGLFLGLVYLFKKFVTSFSGGIKSFQKIMGQGGEVLDQFKNNLKSMQTQVRAKAILNIAIAVALLAGAAVVLASVPIKKLEAALAAIGGLMLSLVASMRLLTAGGGKKGVPDAKTIAKQSGQIVALGAALIEFATAVFIMAGAVALMGQLDPKTMKQGLEGIGAVVVGITAATAILSKTGGGATIFATASALIVLAAGLTAFAAVMKLYSKIDFGTIKDGGGKAALVVFAMGIAMRAFGPGAISGSIGLIVAAGALKIMAGVLQDMQKLSWGDVIKSVGALVVLLDSLAVASEAFNPASAGSLLVMAAALFVLGKVLISLAKVPFWDLVKAVLAIAGAILILSITAAALSELSPLVAALGTALLLLGGAIFLAGAGVFLFASAMGILAVVGPAAFQALSDGIDQLVAALPKIGEAIGGFLVSIITGIVKAAGPLAKALGKLLGILLDEVIKLIPKAQMLIQKLINALLNIIGHSQAHAAKVMISFLLAMLTAIDKKMDKFINRGTDIIVKFIEGMANADVRIANATGRAILHFLNGLDRAVKKYGPQIRLAGLQLAFDIVDGMTGGLLSYGLTQVKAAAQELADHLPGWMKKVLGIKSPSTVMRDQVGKWAALGVADGIDKNAVHVTRSSQDMANESLKAMQATFARAASSTNGLMNLRPKITPILDLSQLHKDALGIQSHIPVPTITPKTSRNKARDAAPSQHPHSNTDSKGGDTYNFEQNNYSPEPINHRKAYRGTKSQIALFREVKGK